MILETTKFYAKWPSVRNFGQKRELQNLEKWLCKVGISNSLRNTTVQFFRLCSRLEFKLFFVIYGNQDIFKQIEQSARIG